jgi:hypothetical protein
VTYDLAARRAVHIDELRARVRFLRDAVDERDHEIVALRHDIADRDARIDTLERELYGYTG